MSVATTTAPAELRERAQWLLYRVEERGGKPTKVPYCPRDPKRKASSTDPSTWATFEEAEAASSEADGIGIVATAEDPLVGFDFDDCIDEYGGVDPWVAGKVSALDSYTERSPSGHGLRVFVKGRLTRARRKKGKFEVYDDKRFFTSNDAQGSMFSGLAMMVDAGTLLIPRSAEELVRELLLLRVDLSPTGQERIAAATGHDDCADSLALALGPYRDRQGRWRVHLPDLARCDLPVTNVSTRGARTRAYWAPKLARNAERDRENDDLLRASGWRVLRLWEHTEPHAAADEIAAAAEWAPGR